MKINLLFLFILLLGLNACATKSKTTSQPVQSTGTGTLLINPVSFNKQAYIREAVRNECNLDGKLVQFIEQYAAGQYAKIITGSSTGSRDAQILTIEIEQVQGGGGGAWSGGKMVLINGKVTQNGRVLGDFKGRRYSGGGMFGGYKGTCAILGRCVKALGKDIAEWLTHPASKAVLGDL